MPTHQKLSSFVRFEDQETFERDYYLAHTNRRRFRWRSIVLLLLMLAFMLFLTAGLIFGGFHWLPLAIILATGLIWLILVIYLSVRRLKISYGYAALTTRRLIYYEFNDHPEENYQHVVTAHLDDLTGVELRTSWSLFTRSFSMDVYTAQRAIRIGARGLVGLLNIFGKRTILEPGPDAVQFIQDMTGTIAARKHQLLAGGGSR
jgi:hypothetical protein